MEDDIDYGALFGVDLGGKEQELAAPAGEEQTVEGAQGEKEAEAAVPPAENDTQTPQAAEQTGTQPEQTPEQNAAFAAARRKAEQERDAAVQQARQDAERTIAEAFTMAGLTNPYTRQPVTTKAEYDAYREQYERERNERVRKKVGMSDDEFKQYVDSLPEVRQAKEAAAAAETAARQARSQQARMKVEEQLKEIGALDPSVKTLEDLAKMANYAAFYDMVKRGLTLAEAYKLANYDALTQGAAAAAKQAAINAAAGKEHLTPTTPRGTGAVSVPADVMEQYRAFNPGATDAEIQAHYNKYHKS